MTIPANDAFTLALAHDSPVRRPSRSRSITRSPSPKIAFTTPPPPPLADMKRRSGARHRKQKSSVSNGAPTANGTLAQVDENDALERPRSQPTNGHARPADAAVKAVKKVDWEIPRKALHSSIGFLTLYLYTSGGSIERVVVVLAGALCVIVPADVLRLNWPRFERIYERALGFLMRESEKKQSNGVIWYILGVLFVLSLYPKDIAVMSILILSWADTAASTFGRLWGSLTPRLPARAPLLRVPLAPRKSLAGFLAAALTGAGIAFTFWGWVAPAVGDAHAGWAWGRGVGALEGGLRAVPTGGWAGLGVVSVVAGLVTALAEALDLGSLDDNLTLPILSGGCIWGFLKVLSWFSA
ncbi:hypothetical protein FA95DRAFT_852551 [Auriscalpium vulgare]|uniref:Uncharacterized protein n=1 Tax=Auriscalpium vulgare TaxID=40419 RepID=A0ACB8R9B1_9AGAM|nr:hypothetical protein FA95DRAFT_852551 [Auriscalpium vulgare]